MTVTVFNMMQTIPAANYGHRSAELPLHFQCTTEAELPTANLQDGDTANTEDTAKRWKRVAGAWVADTVIDVIAVALQVAGPTGLILGSWLDGEYLKRVGLTAVGATVAGGGTVTSVALGAPSEFSVSGSPITDSGTLAFQFASPLLVAHGGTGAGTLGSNAIVATGLTSTAAFTAIALNQMTSSFLNGNGAFSFIPATPGGTVTSVGLTAPSEFAISGSPVTGAGTLAVGFIAPVAVSHGGTGAGTLGSNAVVMTGLSSNAAFTSVLLNQMTSSVLAGTGAFVTPPAQPVRSGLSSEYLDGKGTFSVPTNPAPGVGTVTSVALAAPQEFSISGSPVTGAGTLAFQFSSPTVVAHGGTGMGSFAANSLIKAGLGSSAKFQSIPLTNLTSDYMRGDGAFAPLSLPAAGWEFLAATKLGSDNAKMSKIVFPGRDELMIKATVVGLTKSAIPMLFLNSSAAGLYGTRYLTFAPGSVTPIDAPTQNSLGASLCGSNAVEGKTLTVMMSNRFGSAKAFSTESFYQSPTQASSPRLEFGGGQYMDSTQVTTLQMVLSSAPASYKSGSGVMVWGRNY